MKRASLILVAIVFLLSNPNAAATPGQNAHRLTAADYRKSPWAIEPPEGLQLTAGTVMLLNLTPLVSVVMRS